MLCVQPVRRLVGELVSGWCGEVRGPVAG
jgi:hypothetical protein